MIVADLLLHSAAGLGSSNLTSDLGVVVKGGGGGGAKDCLLEDENRKVMVHVANHLLGDGDHSLKDDYYGWYPLTLEGSEQPWV